MKNIVLLVFLFAVSTMTKGDIIELNDVYLEAEKTIGINRGYFIPQNSVPKYHFNLGLDLEDGLGILYADNRISSVVDQSQFRYVALDSEVGINTTVGLQLYYRHYSGHMLDATSTDRFPQENTVGLRFSLLKD